MTRNNGVRDDPASLDEVVKRKCFVVAAFGKTSDEKRVSKQVLKHLIKKTLEPRGYDVKRADELAAEGLITNQIIERLLDDDLVIADLTGLNPNVFYEMAVRHAARKPIIHLITEGIDVPFDVQNMRAVQYSLIDPDQLEHAQHELEEKVVAIEDCGFKAASNPITAARDVAILRQSEQPEVRETAVVLHAVNELRDEVRQINHRVSRSDPAESAARRRMESRRARYMQLSNHIEGEALNQLATSGEPLTEEELAEKIGSPPPLLLTEALKRMRDREEAYLLSDGRWSAVPF